MRKYLIKYALVLLLFTGAPLLAKMVLPNELGMMVTVFLLLVVYPAFFIANGITSMIDTKKNWYTTLVFVGIFALSYAVIIDMKELYYSFIYLLLGYITMLGGIAIRKIPPKNDKDHHF